MSVHYALGYDPGREGAATLLGPAGIVCVWAWRTRTSGGRRVYQLAVASRESGWSVAWKRYATMGQVGRAIASRAARESAGSQLRARVESVYISHRPNMRTSLALAASLGRLVGPVERHVVGRVVNEVRPAEWRKAVLRLHGRTKREEAKSLSLRLMPERHDGLAEALSALSTALGRPVEHLDHVTDSAGIAEFEMMQGGSDE